MRCSQLDGGNTAVAPEACYLISVTLGNPLGIHVEDCCGNEEIRELSARYFFAEAAVAFAGNWWPFRLTVLLSPVIEGTRS